MDLLNKLLEKKKVAQDKDIKDRDGTQPKKYFAKDAEGDDMAKSTKAARARHFEKGRKSADDDDSAYEPAPGDKSAETKPSQHTKKYKKMFGEEEQDECWDGYTQKGMKKKGDRMVPNCVPESVEEGKLVDTYHNILDIILQKIKIKVEKEYKKNSERGVGIINTLGAMVGHKVTDKQQQKDKLFLKFGEETEIQEDAAVDAAQLKAKHAEELERLKANHEKELESLQDRHDRESKRVDDSKEKETQDKQIQSKRDADRKSAEKKKESQSEQLEESVNIKKALSKIKGLSKKQMDFLQSLPQAQLTVIAQQLSSLVMGESYAKDRAKRLKDTLKKHDKRMMKSAKDSIKKYEKGRKEETEVEEDRDYKKEYANYHSDPEQIKRRTKRNEARRSLKDRKDIEGKDVHHKDNNPMNNDKSNLSIVSQKYNRSEPRLRKLKEKGLLPNGRK